MKQTASLWLFTYWNELRNGRKAPNRFEIEPKKIGPLLPETFILETDESRSFRFRLAGTRICETYGYELKGLDFVTFWKDRNEREAVESLLHTIKEDGSAATLEFTAANDEGETCRFEIILLPLIHAGEQVNRIMGSMSPLEEPYWLGSKRLSVQKLNDLDLIWPDSKPNFGQSDDNDNLTISPSGTDRIVNANGRLFRIIEGGKH